MFIVWSAKWIQPYITCLWSMVEQRTVQSNGIHESSAHTHMAIVHQTLHLSDIEIGRQRRKNKIKINNNIKRHFYNLQLNAKQRRDGSRCLFFHLPLCGIVCRFWVFSFSPYDPCVPAFISANLSYEPWKCYTILNECNVVFGSAPINTMVLLLQASLQCGPAFCRPYIALIALLNRLDWYERIYLRTYNFIISFSVRPRTYF